MNAVQLITPQASGFIVPQSYGALSYTPLSASNVSFQDVFASINSENKGLQFTSSSASNDMKEALTALDNIFSLMENELESVPVFIPDGTIKQSPEVDSFQSGLLDKISEFINTVKEWFSNVTGISSDDAKTIQSGAQSVKALATSIHSETSDITKQAAVPSILPEWIQSLQTSSPINGGLTLPNGSDLTIKIEESISEYSWFAMRAETIGNIGSGQESIQSEVNSPKFEMVFLQLKMTEQQISIFPYKADGSSNLPINSWNALQPDLEGNIHLQPQVPLWAKIDSDSLLVAFKQKGDLYTQLNKESIDPQKQPMIVRIPLAWLLAHYQIAPQLNNEDNYTAVSENAENTKAIQNAAQLVPVLQVSVSDEEPLVLTGQNMTFPLFELTTVGSHVSKGDSKPPMTLTLDIPALKAEQGQEINTNGVSFTASYIEGSDVKIAFQQIQSPQTVSNGDRLQTADVQDAVSNEAVKQLYQIMKDLELKPLLVSLSGIKNEGLKPMRENILSEIKEIRQLAEAYLLKFEGATQQKILVSTNSMVIRQTALTAENALPIQLKATVYESQSSATLIEKSISELLNTSVPVEDAAELKDRELSSVVSPKESAMIQGNAPEPMPQSVKEAVLTQVAERAVWMVQKQVTQIKMVLEPEHLGTLLMQVNHELGAVTAKITTPSPVIGDFLKANMEGLKTSLAQEGIHLQNVSVFVSSNFNPNGQSFSWERTFWENRSEAIFSVNSVDEVSIVSRPRMNSRLVDLLA